ncbi:MAG: hypothetical protein AAGE61_08185 [Pseudomonadota bacterium]
MEPLAICVCNGRADTAEKVRRFFINSDLIAVFQFVVTDYLAADAMVQSFIGPKQISLNVFDKPGSNETVCEIIPDRDPPA